MKNDYHTFWEASQPNGQEFSWRWEKRGEALQKWGFAVPSQEAIQKIAELSPVIELGAGTGYWSKLVHEAGGTVEAYDKAPPGSVDSGNTYPFQQTEPWFPVCRGDEGLLPKHAARTLLLVWPCYQSDFAYNCLRRFSGEYVVYVGEGPYGCTANDRFHERLASRWTSVDHVAIPHWDGIHDFLEVFRRTSRC